MEKNLQELLTTMTDVMQSQQEAIAKQQAEIQQLKANAGKTDEEKEQSATNEVVDKVMKEFRF